MNPNMAYYALETKIATKKGRILNKSAWEKFLDSPSVDVLINHLSENDEFSKAFEGLEIKNLERNNLETVLDKFKTLEIENLLHYFAGPYKEFIKAVLMEGEINDLSLILRKLSREESLDGIEERFVHSKIYTNLNFDELLLSKNVEQLIQKIKDGPYYNSLRNLTKDIAIQKEFHIEMKMYVALYKNILERAKKLRKIDEKIATEIVGLRIDLLNIQWIYRALNFYHISPEETLIYSLEGGKTLGYNRLKKLCYASIDNFKKMVFEFFRYDFFNNLADEDINVVINSYMLNYFRKNSYDGIGTPLSFMYLLNIIVNDLTSITEGIQYKVPREKLKNYLAYKI